MCVSVHTCSYSHMLKGAYSHVPAGVDSAVNDLSNSLYLVCLARTRVKHLDKVCEDAGPPHKQVIII